LFLNPDQLDIVLQPSNLVFKDFNLVHEDLFLFSQDLHAHVTGTLNAHLLRLGSKSRKVNLSVLHTALFLQIVLQLLHFLAKALLLGVFVVSVLHKLALQLEQLLVCNLAALHLASQFVLQQCQTLKVALLHNSLLLKNGVSLLSQVIVF